MGGAPVIIAQFLRYFVAGIAFFSGVYVPILYVYAIYRLIRIIDEQSAMEKTQQVKAEQDGEQTDHPKTGIE